MLDEKFKRFINEWLYDQLESKGLSIDEMNRIVSEAQVDIEIDTEKTLARWLK